MPLQLFQHGLAVFGVKMKQHLGVAGGTELMAFPLQSRAQFTVIVDFAIKGNGKPPLRKHHGLPAAGRQVNYRKAAVTEADALLRGPAIGPRHPAARPHAIAHGDQFRFVHEGSFFAVSQD